MLPLCLFACGDDDGDDGPRTLSATFNATVGGAAVSCSTMYSGLGVTSTTAQIADARMFLSGVEVRNGAGEWVEMALEESVWQRDGVALLDFEDGSGACADSGTPSTNDTLTGEVPAGTYDGIRFQVGIPFALNHNDNATAPAPFNVPGMFWNWRGGYKFLRVDWMVPGGAVPRWNVHIGSTGCVADAPTTAPVAECGRGNAATIELTGMDPDAEMVDIDLSALVASADLLADTSSTPPGCQSNPMEPNECSAVWTALGLSFDTGVCVGNCAGQTVFQ